MSTLARVKNIKNPCKWYLEGLKMFALFINSFRNPDTRWPIEIMNNWSNLSAFILNSPSAKEICLEL